jgi:AraC family transcriptional regulator of adaptative response/methylated-DNA-[protein]-cysteine methyltransferase
MQTALCTDSGPNDDYRTDDACWAAVVARDDAADGSFWFSVASTGVYCYPSCAARRPLRRNVAFHRTRADAERAGFRPCKRCRPELEPRREREAAAVARACRAIENAETELSLSALAEAAGFSAHHFQRRFKEIVGITPKQYATACRTRRLHGALGTSSTVTAALYDAGFNSSGRLYATSGDVLGMAPRTFARGGAGERIRWATGRGSLGTVLVAATERGICAILLGDRESELAEDLAGRFPRATLERADNDSEYTRWLTAALELVEAPGRHTALPLDVAGTAFQHRVWAALREIPAGATTTYQALAQRIGQPKAARAVATACASNPVAVAIPCHRVIGRDGSLRGYRWGVERKAALLRKESHE